MRKSGNEAFEIRDSHLRIAGIWGSVSMAKEYKPSEYAKIMLALEILENPDDFYILPALTEEEREKAIMDFCSDKYGINGKKYAKNTLKFAKLVKSSGDYDEWLAYTKIAVMSKVDTFCKENGIIFESVTEEDINER